MNQKQSKVLVKAIIQIGKISICLTITSFPFEAPGIKLGNRPATFKAKESIFLAIAGPTESIPSPADFHIARL